MIALPPPPQAHDVNDQTQTRRIIEQQLNTMDATLRAIPTSDMLDPVGDYGCTGDGVVDDTVNLLACLMDAYTQNKVVNGRNYTFKIAATGIGTVTAGAFVVGRAYTILTVGTTSFTGIGANANSVGTTFFATGVGTGTGTATPSALCMQGPGLIFNSAPHGVSGGCGILVSGTGYTAMVIGGAPQFMRFTMRGTGNAADGIIMQNPLLALMQHVRVYNLAGFGIKVNRCWDTLFGTLSTEICGTAAKPAISFNDDGDTCNMSHVLRIQAEDATGQAINISPNTLSSVYHEIHSEGLVASTITAGSFVTGTTYTISTVGTTNFTAIGAAQNTVGSAFTATGAGAGSGTAAQVAWTLGGAGCHYGTVRLAAASGLPGAWLRGAYATYDTLRVENSCPVVLEGTSTSSITLHEPNLTGPVSEYPGQGGKLILEGGNAATIRTNWVGATGQRYMEPEDTGSWTPTISFGGSSANVTYGTQSGTWTRIGKLVMVTCDLTLTNNGTGVGNALILGLPFTVSESAAVVVGFYANITGLTLVGTSSLGLFGRADSGGTSIIIAWANADAAPTQLTDTQISNTARFILSCTYRST